MPQDRFALRFFVRELALHLWFLPIGRDVRRSRGSKKMAEADKKEVGEYEVGYCKPPKRTQFKPGQRANPRGRGRAARNPASPKVLDNTLLEVMNEPVTVRDANGKRRKEPGIKVAMMAVLKKAMQGDASALTAIMGLVRRNKLSENPGGGVLVVERIPQTPEEIAAFERELAEQQAPYRGNTGLPAAPGDDGKK
jgi:hypothetical protein